MKSGHIVAICLYIILVVFFQTRLVQLWLCINQASGGEVGPCFYCSPGTTWCGQTPRSWRYTAKLITRRCYQHQLYHNMINTNCTTTWSTQIIPQHDQHKLYHSMINTKYTTTWSARIIPQHDQHKLYHNMINTNYTTAWSTQIIPQHDQHKLYHSMSVASLNMLRRIECD